MTAPGGLTDTRFWHWILVGLGGWATFVGFRDRDEMVSRRSRLLWNESGGRAVRPASRSEFTQYPAGFSFLVWRQFKLFVGIGALMGVFGFLFAMFVEGFRREHGGESVVQAMLSGSQTYGFLGPGS